MGWNCDSVEAVIGPHMKPPPVRLTVPLSRPPCAAAPGTAMAAVVAADDGSILLRGLSPTSGDPGRRGSNSSSVPALSNRGAPGTGKMHGQNDLFLGYLRPIPLQGPPKRFFLGYVITHRAQWGITQPRKYLFGQPCISHCHPEKGENNPSTYLSTYLALNNSVCLVIRLHSLRDVNAALTRCKRNVDTVI